MTDRFVCRGSLNTTIRTLLEGAIKCLDWDSVTSWVSYIFNSVDAFIMHTILLLYAHFSQGIYRTLFARLINRDVQCLLQSALSEPRFVFVYLLFTDQNLSYTIAK